MFYRIWTKLLTHATISISIHVWIDINVFLLCLFMATMCRANGRLINLQVEIGLKPTPSLRASLALEHLTTYLRII
jgi:hypothetical protein